MKQRGYIDRAVRWLKLKILHINDSPNRIAKGVAIGLFIAWTPLVGFHIVIAIAASVLFRANKIAALVAIWINNPFTLVPMFYPGFLLGRTVVRAWNPALASSKEDIKELLHRFTSVGDFITNFHRPEFWHDIFDLLVKVGLELWIGCLILGTISAIIGYFATYGFIMWHRRKKDRISYMIE